MPTVVDEIQIAAFKNRVLEQVVRQLRFRAVELPPCTENKLNRSTEILHRQFGGGPALHLFAGIRCERRRDNSER